MRDKNRPTVSFLMPAKNAGQTLDLAVESTLRCMGRDDELIVIDDASEDTTLEIAKRLSSSDSRVKVFSNTSSLGVAGALNIGLEAAAGQIIARMDADDVALPWRSRRALRLMKKSGADFVFSNAILFGSSLRFPIPQLPLPMGDHEIKAELAWGNPLVHPTMYARSKAMRDLNGYSELAAEDLDLWLRATDLNFVFAKDAWWGILYRVHPAQVTQSPEWLALGNESSASTQRLASQTKVSPLRNLMTFAGRMLLSLSRRKN